MIMTWWSCYCLVVYALPHVTHALKSRPNCFERNSSAHDHSSLSNQIIIRFAWDMPSKNDTEALYVQVQRRLVESGEWDRWALLFLLLDSRVLRLTMTNVMFEAYNWYWWTSWMRAGGQTTWDIGVKVRRGLTWLLHCWTYTLITACRKCARYGASIISSAIKRIGTACPK